MKALKIKWCLFMQKPITPKSPPTSGSNSRRSPKVDISQIHHIATFESHWCNSFGNIVDTRCKIQDFHTESPTITLKVERG